MDITKELSKKGADAAKIAKYVTKKPEYIEQLIEGITKDKGSIKFGYEKVLRLVSEQNPELIYPYFDIFKDLRVCDNSFLKWGAIITIGNLAKADSENKIDAIFKDFCSVIKGPVMVTAANTIGSLAKIALAKPYLTEQITKEILKVEKANFVYHDQPSDECRNVAIGHSIDSLEMFFEQIDNKNIVIRFVKRQLKNTRAKVVKKAEKFLKKHVS